MIEDTYVEGKFFSFFVSIVLVLSILTGVVGSIDDAEKEVVLLTTHDDSERSYLIKQGIDIIDIYGHYYLINVDDEELKLLREEGFKIDLMEDKDKIYLNGREYQANIDLSKYVVKDFEQFSDYKEKLFLVQMLGPVNPEWRDKLEDIGVDIVNYVPNYAYLVKSDRNEFNKVKELFFVDRIIYYAAEFKIQKDIDSRFVNIEMLSNQDGLYGLDHSINVLSRSETGYGKEIKAYVPDKRDLYKIAERNDVYSITRYSSNKLMSEMTSQIIGGYWDQGSPSTPYRGEGDFGAYVNQIGYTGKDVVIGFADTGLGDGSSGDAGHADFTGRVAGGHDYRLYSSDWADGHGHGTHVAGIAVGDTYNGNNLTYAGHGPYYLSQGLAYDSDIYVQKIFDDSGSWIDNIPSIYGILEDARGDGNVYIHSNSWGEDTGDGIYDYRDSGYDRGVRDSDGQTAGNQPMVVVVSAGNNGQDGFSTIASPGNGKNVITVGASETYMPDATSYGNKAINSDDPEEVFSYSSKGWTNDNRVKPTVVAPGHTVLSTSTPEEGGNNLYGLYSADARYEWSSGTSQSTPAGAGASAVIVEYYKDRYGVRPSPAMVKSLMVNAAEDLKRDHDGDGDIDYIPNKYEGWGRINLVPICAPDVNVITKDQRSVLKTGETDTFDIGYYDSDTPLKVTLSWTDKEGMSNEGLAIKNDLDLEIIAPNGDVYRGNSFSTGYTPADGDTDPDFDVDSDGDDDRNVVENIFISSDDLQAGTYKVRIRGENIPADANNDGEASQDYALVMYNADTLSSDGIVQIEKDRYGVEDVVNVSLEDRDLTQETVNLDIFSDTESTGENITLNKVSMGSYFGSLRVSSDDSEGVLQVDDEDKIEVNYLDEDTGDGDSELKKDTAMIDGSPPTMMKRSVTTKLAAEIIIEADEICTAELRYGRAGQINKKIKSEELKIDHSFIVEDLKPRSTYHYDIICKDQVGNQVLYDNQGEHYSFNSRSIDDMEGGNIGWTTTSNWYLSDPGSGNTLWSCGNGSYEREWYEVLTSPLLNTSGWDESEITWSHRYDLEQNKDGGVFQIENKSGWQSIVPDGGYDGTLQYGYGNQLEGEEAFTGEISWTEESVDLDRYLHDDTFRFRFILSTDNVDTDDIGWLIDDIEVNGTLEPIPDFSYEPISPSTSDSVMFNDESEDQDGIIVNWTWNFGDGNLSYEEDPVHSYADDGEYQVELEVEDDFGVERRISKEISISNEEPTANFSINRTVVRSGDLIGFEDSSYDQDGKIVNWTWDFGDGNISYSKDPEHRYTKDENFLVKLTVKDDDGGEDQKILMIEVMNGVPRADFEFSPESNITTKDHVQFLDFSTDVDGKIVNWTWNFGDGHVSYIKDPEHRFADDGNYTVVLKVVDDDGTGTESMKDISILNSEPSADFIFAPKDPSTNNKIRFTDRSSDYDGKISSWQWDFGDGTSSDIRSPEHRYADNGTFTIKLTVRDDDGAVSSKSVKIDVRNVPPDVDFTFEYEGGKTSKVIYFSDNSTDPDGSVINWTWYLGDGSIKYGEDLKYRFKSDGEYEVKLIIRDDDGDTNSVEKTVVVEKKEGVPNISAALICVSILISFSIVALISSSKKGRKYS